MKTAIVILNWNTKDFLGRFLPGIIESVKNVEGTEVIVADNASTDGSVKFMKDNFPEIRTIAFDKNHGFTGGYNKAFEEVVIKAGKDAPEYFLLMNSDIEAQEGWLEPLVSWMDENPDCGACAPKLHSWHEREKFEYAGAAGGYIDSFGYPFCRGRIMGKVERDMGQYDHMNPNVFWVSGACFMARSKVFMKVRGLDERFFVHMEEIDLCWRMQLAGYKICTINTSVVYHVGGGTLPNNSPKKLFFNFRNNLLMLDNNLAFTYALRHFKKKGKIKNAAKKGLREANRIIRIRMVMDGIAAAVYLLTFRFKSFNAVVKAHKEFRQLRKRMTVGKVIDFLKKGINREVRHIYGKWIILTSLLHSRQIHAGIHETDFFNY